MVGILIERLRPKTTRMELVWIVVALGLIAAVSFILITRIAAANNAESMPLHLPDLSQSTYISVYRDEELIRQNEQKKYSIGNQEQQKTPVAPVTTPVVTTVPAVRVGIDVSEHQGLIDWREVKRNGIEFAFIRVGARGWAGGSLIFDNQFEANIEGAKSVGIKVGVYFFSQAINEEEAIEEADFVLAALNGRQLDYPVVYDLETVLEISGRANYLSSAQCSLNARAFCDRIEAAGYTVMLYGGIYDISRYDASLLAQYDIWFAEYDVSQPRMVPFDFSIWQFTSNGVIAGINTYVDLNLQFEATAEKKLPDFVVIF